MEVLFVLPWKKIQFLEITEWQHFLSMYQDSTGHCCQPDNTIQYFFYSVYIALALILAWNNLITQIFYVEQFSVPENTSQVKNDILIRIGKKLVIVFYLDQWCGKDKLS